MKLDITSQNFKKREKTILEMLISRAFHVQFYEFFTLFT